MVNLEQKVIDIYLNITNVTVCKILTFTVRDNS